MALATPQTALVATDSTLDQMLASQKPLMMLLWNGDSLRSDLKNEFDKIVTEHGNRLQIVTINTHDNPHAAARFDVEKHPVVIGWHNGEQIVRRSRPWGADVRALADQLLAALPPETAVAQPVQQIIKANEPFHVTDADFEQMVINSDLPVLVDFWATWCGPCKQIAPILTKLAAEFAGKIRIAKVDVDQNPGLSQAFGIQSIPTLMFVKNKKIVGQTAGALPEVTLRDTINKLIALKV